MRKWKYFRSVVKCSLYCLPSLFLFYMGSELLFTSRLKMPKALNEPHCPECVENQREDNIQAHWRVTNSSHDTGKQVINEHKTSPRDVVLLNDSLPEVTENMEDAVMPYFVDSKDPNGPGEGGAAVLSSPAEKKLASYKDGWSRHHFNEYVSKKISVHRTLPDCRFDECKMRTESFKGTVSEVAVIIIFNNEAWTTLLRTVHSVLSRTPEHLLREIILVDDKSKYDYLKAPLDKYFKDFTKVKIVRAPKKGGLTRARLLGFEASTAPVLVFLDSHVECFPGWSDSILMRIAENSQAVVFPIMESINDHNFGVRCGNDHHYYCTFQLKNMWFQWELIPQREKDRRKDKADSYRSPTMPGGLFAIHRDFFIKVGTYDPDLAFWGGENIELSFKVWMCGGSLEMDPCSHIAHVFRKGTPVKGTPGQVLKNSVRVAEVWMDDFKNYFYERLGYREVDYGNVTARKTLRQNLQCHSFQWYLKNIYPENIIPSNKTYAGQIRSLASDVCLDSAGSTSGHPITYGCHNLGENQVWYMGESGQIQQDDGFVCAEEAKVVLRPKQCQQPGPQWQYREDKTLYNKPTGQCMTAIEKDSKIILTPCSDNTFQKWEVQRRRTDLVFPAV